MYSFKFVCRNFQNWSLNMLKKRALKSSSFPTSGLWSTTHLTCSLMPTVSCSFLSTLTQMSSTFNWQMSGSFNWQMSGTFNWQVSGTFNCQLYGSDDCLIDSTYSNTSLNQLWLSLGLNHLITFVMFRLLFLCCLTWHYTLLYIPSNLLWKDW